MRLADAPRRKVSGVGVRANGRNRSGASIATPDDVSALSLAAPPETTDQMEVARTVMRRDAGLLNKLAYNGDPETNTTATYKYRDADQRRAYMRDLMRKRRSAQRRSSDGQQTPPVH